MYHALDALLLSGEGQEKAGGWGGASKVDGVGVGCTIVTALLDRKRRQVGYSSLISIPLRIEPLAVWIRGGIVICALSTASSCR